MAECSKVEDDHGAVSAAALSLHPPISWVSGANPYSNLSSFSYTPFYWYPFLLTLSRRLSSMSLEISYQDLSIICPKGSFFGYNGSGKRNTNGNFRFIEENVYLLCKKLCMLGLADSTALDLFVVFISNDGKKIPLWHQKPSSSSDGLVIWDYHVICIQKKAEDGSAYHLIWDLDSSLPFPLPLGQYVSEAFRPDLPLKSTYRRLLRVIHAPIFLRHFASNRAHMRDALGNWISPPPNYAPIIAQDGSENNFDEYIGMRGADVKNDIKSLIDYLYTNKLGVLIKEAILEAFFSHIH